MAHWITQPDKYSFSQYLLSIVCKHNNLSLRHDVFDLTYRR
jgi:hypothetical protein